MTYNFISFVNSSVSTQLSSTVMYPLMYPPLIEMVLFNIFDEINEFQILLFNSNMGLCLVIDLILVL
jgi:hypothetical protein